MAHAVYMSEADAWWTLERQRAALANALPGAKVYIDEMEPRDRQGRAVSRLGQRKVLLRTTSRPTPLTITIASLAVLAWTEDDLRAVLAAVIARGAVLVSLDDGVVYAENGDVNAVVLAWKAARTKSRLEGAAKRGGMATKEKVEAATAAKIEPYKHLWGDPRYLSTDVLKMMGVSRNTANKHMKATWEQVVRKNRERFQRIERKARRTKALDKLVAEAQEQGEYE